MSEPSGCSASYTKMFIVIWTDPVSHRLLRKFLCMAQPPPIVFFVFSHINYVSLRTHCSVPQWPTSLPAGLVGYWRQSSQATACFCLLPWFKQRGILTGLCLLSEVGYDERWLPRECTDSVTQNACALPLLWETAYPDQSFSVTPAYPFLCISAWENERQWLGRQPN